MTTKQTIHSNLAIPPGEFLEEVIDELGMTKDELSQRMGRPSAKLSQIFKGDKSITPETALQLEKVVGVPAHIWTGLEAEYRLTLARNADIERELTTKDETGFVSRFCYNELAKIGEVERHTRAADKVKALQAFFGVASLKNVLEIKRYQAAFRYGQPSKGERSLEAVAAWLRVGERKAQQRQCPPFDRSKLLSMLNNFRGMTSERPERFAPRLREELAECGVVLVLCPHFPKTRAHGATFWINSTKAVVMMTVRFKWADIFWFSLFHEIGHIVLHGKKGVILEDGVTDEIESEADAFASDALIPPREYARFIELNDFYPDAISVFARRVGVHPGIVVGRLQHDGQLSYAIGNKLRTKYVLTSKQSNGE